MTEHKEHTALHHRKDTYISDSVVMLHLMFGMTFLLSTYLLSEPPSLHCTLSCPDMEMILTSFILVQSIIFNYSFIHLC